MDANARPKRCGLIAAILLSLVLLVGAVSLPQPASSSPVPRHLLAYRYATWQQGKWYCWGGTGPSCYDCSGLVVSAYRYAGIYLPRTTYGMLSDPQLIQIPRWETRWGDLAFYGSGHVELVGPWGGTIGAHSSGERISWVPYSAWWHPTMYFRVAGAGG